MNVPKPRNPPNPGPDPREDFTVCDLSKLAGANIRQARAQARLSIRMLGDKSGVSQAVISAAERGDRNCTLANLADIAAALGRDPSWFLQDPEAAPCQRCHGKPLRGFLCLACGQNGGLA